MARLGSNARAAVLAAAAALTGAGCSWGWEGIAPVLVVYDNALAEGFRDESYGVRGGPDLCDGTTFVSGGCSYLERLAAGIYGAFRFVKVDSDGATVPMALENYRALEFWIRPGAGQAISSFLVHCFHPRGADPGYFIPGVILGESDVRERREDGWQKVSVSLSRLVPSGEQAHGCEVQSQLEMVDRDFHLDNVWFGY
jgi:hypothetical protein